jgi:hypothetical protein
MPSAMSPVSEGVVQVRMASSPSTVNVDTVLDTARISGHSAPVVSAEFSVHSAVERCSPLQATVAFFGDVGAVMLSTLATVLLLRRHIPRPQTGP